MRVRENRHKKLAVFLTFALISAVSYGGRRTADTEDHRLAPIEIGETAELTVNPEEVDIHTKVTCPLCGEVFTGIEWTYCDDRIDADMDTVDWTVFPGKSEEHGHVIFRGLKGGLAKVHIRYMFGCHLSVWCGNDGESVRLDEETQADETYTIPVLDTFTLAYDAGGGSREPAAQVVKEAAPEHTFRVTEAAPEKNGMEFTGWSSSPDGPVKYRAGDTVTLISPNRTQATLYAVWVPDSA